MSTQGVQLHEEESYVVMDNGIVKVCIANPGGYVTGIQYNGVDNILECSNKDDDKGYWDVVLNYADESGTTGKPVRIKGSSFGVIGENEEQVEISFTRTWDQCLPLNIDIRYAMLRDSPGFYSYAIFEHPEDGPAFTIPQIRIVFKLREDRYHYMAIADDRQRCMPLPEERSNGIILDPEEAVLIVHPVEDPFFKAEVDDKYQYSCDNKDLKVHGWISFGKETEAPMGFWVIIPSDEFRSGGPVKQNLTSHVGPISLAMFLSAHYAGDDIVLELAQNEPWKKVFGPIFVYLNTSSDDQDPKLLWEDAKDQMTEQVQSWPYDFPASEDYQKSDQRGSVCGTLRVRDRYLCDDDIVKQGAYIGMAPPGEAGSWQTECKGYQFWTKTNEEGYFSIHNIRSGDYDLYAWVPGFIGDYRHDNCLTITPGCEKNVGDIVYEPPRDGPTLWEIGIPDRSAEEFYVPDPNPLFINKLYIDHDKFRQHGLWKRYAELYPNEDLVYTVGVSDCRNDWFFAQVTRKNDDGTYQGTTWQIKFTLDDVVEGGTYKLRLALASANAAELQVRVNDPNQDEDPLFTTGLIGKDNAIARHGIHGLYSLYCIDVQADLLNKGDNTIYLTQTRATGPFDGIMYDYIRLEAPESSS